MHKSLQTGIIRTQLGDICSFASGTGFKEALQGSRVGTYPFIKVSDLNSKENRKWITTSNNWIDESARKELRATLHPANSVIFAKVGAALKLNKRRLLSRPTAIDNNLMAAVPDVTKVSPEYLYYFLQTQDLGRLCQDGAVPSVNQTHLSAIEIGLPNLNGQARIVSILNLWDEAIAKATRLVELIEDRFGALSIALLKGKLRLAPDTSTWTNIAFNEVSLEITDRNSGRLGTDDVMGVNKTLGMIPMKAHVRAADLSRYKIVPPNAFAYNPMRLNIGSIAMNAHGREVLVSPDYVAFATQPERLNNRFFDHLRRSSIWSDFVSSAGSGGVRIRIYYEHLSALSFRLPSLEIQSRIADMIDTAKREIDIRKQQIVLMDRQKLGLLEKLLTGEWRVSVRDNDVDKLASRLAEEATQ